MRGSIRKRGKHSWQIEVPLGRAPNGKYLRHTETVRGTKCQAELCHAQFITEHEAANNIERSKVVRSPNKAETAFRKWARKKEWRILKRGWPDFMAVRPDGKAIVIEVKDSNDSLHWEQLVILVILNTHGLDVRVSDGTTEGRPLTSGELRFGLQLLGDDSLWGYPTKQPLRALQDRFPTGTDPFYTVKEAAKMLGISERDVIQGITDGQIPGHKVENQVVISRQAFDQWCHNELGVDPTPS